MIEGLTNLASKDGISTEAGFDASLVSQVAKVKLLAEAEQCSADAVDALREAR